MNNLFDDIKMIEEATGLRTRENMFTMGTDVVNTEGKVVFSGDAISCASFVLKAYDKIKDNETK